MTGPTRPAMILAAALALGPSLASAGGASSTDAGQISSGDASSVGASQISTPTATTSAPPQVSSSKLNASAPPALSNVGQGRNAAVAPIKGHDRCDAAAGGSAAQPECANILDNRSDDFTNTSQTAAVPQTPPTDKTSSGLVDDVVNGGTGTVVPLPPN